MTRYDQHGGPRRTDVYTPDVWTTTRAQNRAAVRTCAAHADTAAQLADYCQALGLDPREGQT